MGCGCRVCGGCAFGCGCDCSGGVRDDDGFDWLGRRREGATGGRFKTAEVWSRQRGGGQDRNRGGTLDAESITEAEEDGAEDGEGEEDAEDGAGAERDLGIAGGAGGVLSLVSVTFEESVHGRSPEAVGGLEAEEEAGGRL